jgi:glycosyltransferase involved in cell wall biosynthesis
MAVTKVLHVGHLASLSGADQALLRLTRAMDRGRFESLVVLPSDGPLRSALTDSGVPSRLLPIQWWIPSTLWRPEDFIWQLRGLDTRWQALAELAARENVDLIHSNTLVTIEGALAATALGLPHVWHSRGPFWEKFPPAYAGDWEFFYSMIDEVGDHVACVSSVVLEQTKQYVSKTSCTLISDGVDLSDVSDRETDLDLDGPAEFIACVGGIQQRKGQLDLIDALAIVKREHPQVVLLLCGTFGDEPYANEIRTRIEDTGLGSSVKFLGFRSDVAGIVRRCRLVVHPAKSEGFGLAILEAMALGIPVVATRSGGPEEIIEDGVSGMLVNPSAPLELAHSICTLLANREMAREIGASARARATLFTSSGCAGKFQDLLTQVITASPARPPDRAKATAVAARVLERFRQLAPGPSGS